MQSIKLCWIFQNRKFILEIPAPCANNSREVPVKRKLSMSMCSFVTVTSNNHLWALDKEGRLYRRDVCILGCQEPSPKACTAVVENDWQIV